MKENYHLFILSSIIILGQLVIAPSVGIGMDQTTDSFMYEIELTNITLDGINDGEYPLVEEISTTGGNKFAELAWGHNSSHIAVYIKSIGTGWIGLGLDNAISTASMDTADIIMANIIGGTVMAYDMHAEGIDAPIEDADSYINPDNVAGREVDGESYIEMIIPLSSDDTAGDDHTWALENKYGFFLAYHATDDDISERHTAHSPANMVVEIIDGPFEAMELSIHTEVNFITNESIVNLTAQVYRVNTTIPMDNLELDIYRKTQFGRVYINSSTTDSSGMAHLNITTNHYVGNTTFIIAFKGSSIIVASEASVSVMIDDEGQIGLIEEEEHYHDIRDFFNSEHLMRSILLVSFYTVIGFVFLIYLSVVKGIIQIRRNASQEMKEEST